MVGSTELEHCTLAEIRRLQPCSAYAVRKVFARSPTPEWSGSTGAIYPVIDRLIKRGMIQSEPQAGDPRGRRNLRATAEGEAIVQAWITRLEPWAAEPVPDPIRTRVTYIDQLASDKERMIFLERAIDLTAKALEELKINSAADPNIDRLESMLNRGAIYQLEGRRAWLMELVEIYSAATSPMRTPRSNRIRR